MPWNPDRYHQFKSERAAPFDDLLQLIEVRAGLSVVDLGCGPGELTRRLADADIAEVRQPKAALSNFKVGRTSRSEPLISALPPRACPA